MKDFLALLVRRQDLHFGQAECRCRRQRAGDFPLPGFTSADILTDLQGGRDILSPTDQKIHFLAVFVLPVIYVATAPFELAENDVFQNSPGIGGKFEGHRRGQGMINAVELGRVVHLPLQGIVEEVHREKKINILEIAKIVLHGRQAVDGDCVPEFLVARQAGKIRGQIECEFADLADIAQSVTGDDITIDDVPEIMAQDVGILLSDGFRETAFLHISAEEACELRLSLPGQQIPLGPRHAAGRCILPEGEGIQRDDAVPAGQRHGRLPLHHGGVGAGYKQLDILEFIEAVEPTMPAGQVLYLVQKEILTARRGFDFETGLVEGLEIRGLEFGKTVVFKIEIEDIFSGDVFMLDQVAGDQTHQGGLAGTPDAGDDVDLLLMLHFPGLGQDFPRRESAVGEGIFLMLYKEFCQLSPIHSIPNEIF